VNIKSLSQCGLGTDIESIVRFKNVDQDFLDKIFTKKELDYCRAKSNSAPHLAARYAGKEAIVKAMGNIKKKIISYKEIEIINTKSGAPIATIYNNDCRDVQVKLSLSHCSDKAIAFAIAFTS